MKKLREATNAGVMDAKRALEEANRLFRETSDVDGLFASFSQIRMGPLAVAEYLGLRPNYFDGTQIGGAAFMAMLTHAQNAIEAGLCEVALIAYGSTQRSVSRAAASSREYNHFETPYGMLSPISAYALAAARHMHQYGTTREHLAEVVVAALEGLSGGRA